MAFHEVRGRKLAQVLEHHAIFRITRTDNIDIVFIWGGDELVDKALFVCLAYQRFHFLDLGSLQGLDFREFF